MSFASSSAASGGKFRLRARMRTLGRGATSNGFGPQNGETQHQGEPCFSLALVDEDDEGAQQQARRAGKNGTHDEIILHREHLTDTANETKTHQRKGQLSRKRTRRTADLQPSDASLRFKTLDALYKFIELSCPGTPSLQDAAKVDFFVDVDALGLDTQRAFAFLELTDHRHKIAGHLLRITSANWLPVVSDKNFCAVLQRWLLNAPNRRAAKLRAAFTQIDRFLLGKGKLRYAVLRLNAGETHFQADPSQQLQDVRDHHAQGLHELWELALHAENHASFSDERLEQILTFLERAERNHPTQAIAAGALQALALTTTGTYQRLKQLEAPQRAFHVIHNNISNLVSYPPPQAALLLLRMLAHFASDPMCIAPALDQLGFFAACVQSGASPEICEAILGVYLPILNVSAALSATVADEAKPAHNAGTGAGDYPTVSAPCELQSYSCTELTRELSSSRRRRTKRKRASSVKSVTIGNARASTAALGEFLREITQRAATPACTDVACKLGAAVLVAQIAHGAELQDKLCRAKKCTGRVHIQTKHDPNTLPILHPLRDFLLASKVVPSGVVGLGRWALAKIARRVEARVSHFAPSLRRLRDLVLGTEAHSLDASSAGEGTFHRVGSQASIASASIAVAGLGDEPRSFSSKPETSIPAKGYLGEVYGETNELSASKGIQWMSYETKDHLPNSTDAYVLEVIFHDRELDAVFNFLAHFLGFGHEGWLRLYLVETSQHCPKTQHRLEEALCLAAIATERLLDVPQIAARLLRRGTSAAVSDVAQSHETHEDASRLLNSFRRRATFKFKSARRVCRDDADAEVNARNQLFSNGKCGNLSVQDDIALHRVNVPQPQASPFPYWPALPVLTPIAVQNATSAAVEESMARSLINLLAKTQQGHDLELLLHRAVQTACDILDTIVAARERCGRVARQSVQPAGPAKDIMQRIALQALNLLWLTVDFSPVLLTIPAKPANAFMLDILYKCSYSRAMCPQVRERSTNLLAHLAHRIRTLKDPRVITQRGVLKQKLRASNLLKLAIQHLDEDTEVLRTTGATLMARLPLSEEHQQLLKNSGRATQLLELATESSHKERRAALLALLKYAESDVGQKEIAKLGFYRLLVGCWVAADSQTPDLQDLLSALLQLLAENTANRPKIYQAELRAKEISGWAALSDADWQATLAQATEEDDRSDVGSARIAKAVTNSRRDVRCAFTRWLAELESSLREDASNNLLPKASRSSSDRESQDTMRQSGRGPCSKEEDDFCKAMSAFRAHRLVLETSPQRITSPDRSLLWPFRSIIFAPNASPLNAAPSKSQGAKSALRANDHLARDMTSSLIPYERDNANPESFDEEHDLEMQFRLAKERAWARTNKTDTRGSPTAWSPGANSAARVKTSAARTPKPTPPKSTKRPFAAAGSPLLLPPWKSSSIGPDEKSGNRVWFHETVAGPTNRHSRFTAFSRAQFAAANEKLHHRLRSPVKSLWQEADQAAKLSVDPWAPNIKDIGVTSVTVERETFCFAPAGSEVAAAQETPAQFVARALQHPRNSQRLKRDKMALFGHVEGARVHEELTLYEAPEGRRGYVFYNGPRNIIDLYLDFDKLGAPPSPHDLIHLGRIDVDASLQHDENEDDVKSAVDVHLSARQILDALPGLPDGGSGMLVDTRSLVGKLEPKVFQKIQQPEPPQVYSQNHEDGARIPPPVLGEPLKELAHLERGQAETGVCWTPNGCVLDDTLPFAIRVPGRIVRLIEGAQEEDEGPQLCVEAFDGRRAFLDENPIAKACASVDWELNMKKKGFRDFLDHFDPEDAEIARDLLIGASPLLLSIYRFYCALTPQNPFAMLPPSFLRLLTDIHVLEKKGSTFTHDCMNIFIRVASMVPDDKDAKVRRLNEQCDPLSLKRCRRLMRHEFLDVILRIAHAKYCSSENPSIAAALDHFIQVHVVRYLGPETVLDFDSWRVRYLYTEDVSAVIQAHRSMLIQWFTEMAGTTQRSSRWGGLEKERLAIQEWNQGLRNLGLFTANFTIRESTFAFVLSTTNVVNWVAEWEPMIALSYQDFLEALGRVAELISIPTPEQLEFFGVETIVEFYSLMERTNLWSALDHSSTQAQTRLKIWQKSSDEDGADDSTAEEGTKTDERSLSEKLTLLLELLESRNSIDARREAELSFWISKKKRRSSQDRTVLANNDSHHDNTHEEHAGPTQESELDSDGEVDDAKTSSTKSSTGRRRRSSATELFTLDEEEMAELDEEDVTAVSDDLETFEISTATKLHEMWRSKRARLSDGRFEPRIKVINNTEYDIANLEFHQLPDYFKLENLLASHAACESIRRCWNQTMGDTRAERLRNLRKTLKTPNFIEKASAEQHDNWLKRNGKLPWVTDEQRGRYEDLSEDEKQKDRDIVLVGIEVYLETQFSDEKAV
ncbi:Hypothetical Protein FCC1311_035522 [Hondaea fermentalgiana]|uniref:Uncharacterized protein n=1 Tax=Hondaea fermentalgiana TaxID=2315210 RepID=A0A2R5G8K2_9STRA|nr:Hypothetical Protein FCC1311_035522 [Hondaea fermentalgiana]|eukprot:GBG27330.1 Hypothetical Protein FCC1311_035522 [Hondaea fermentalgiana]